MQPPRRELDRVWDNSLETHLVRLMPGDYYVSRNNEVITTVLGSCVSACIRDVELGIGGMNHFMLPDTDMATGSSASTAARYGTYAMQFLIDDIIRRGGVFENLEVKVFGGGRIVSGISDIGQRNIDFVRAFLADNNLPVAAEDLGQSYPRKVNYFIQSGRVMVKKLRALHRRAIASEEQQYRGSIGTGPETPPAAQVSE